MQAKTTIPLPGGSRAKLGGGEYHAGSGLGRSCELLGGRFNVEWRSSIVVDTEIVVVDGTVLNITRGKGSNAILDDGGMTRLFRVVNASLQLHDIEVRNDSATFGGAIAAISSNLFLNEITFTGNTANDKNGGAMFVYGASNVSFYEKTVFFHNEGNNHGGAVYVHSSTIAWFDVSSFSNITAHYSGEALYVESSSVFWNGVSSLFDNTANHSGGAVYIVKGSTVSWAEDTNFKGAPSRSSNITFVENHATVAGGGVFITAPGEGPTFTNVTFLNNTAEVGGGASIAGCGVSLDVQDGELSATFYDCIFIGNNATTNGGAIDSGSGAVTVIIYTVFEENFAEVSVGTLLLAGSTWLVNCLLVDYISGLDGGQAVLMVGYTIYMQNCTFRINAVDCPPGTFLVEEDQEVRYVRTKSSPTEVRALTLPLTIIELSRDAVKPVFFSHVYSCRTAREAVRLHVLS